MFEGELRWWKKPATSILSSVIAGETFASPEWDALKAGSAKVIESEGDQVGAGTDAKQDRIPSCYVVELREMIQHRPGQDRENKAARRPGHSSDAHDGGDGMARKHIGNGREKIGRPGLVRGAGQAN